MLEASDDEEATIDAPAPTTTALSKQSKHLRGKRARNSSCLTKLTGLNDVKVWKSHSFGLALL